MKLRLEEFLPYRLNVLGAVVSKGLANVYSRRFSLDIPGWRVIATLGQFSQLTAKAIGAHSHMHKTMVSRAIAGLENRGLVERLANPEDRREAFVILTARGQDIYNQIVPLAQNYEASLLEKLSPPDREALDELISFLTEKAAALRKESP